VDLAMDEKIRDLERLAIEGNRLALAKRIQLIPDWEKSLTGDEIRKLLKASRIDYKHFVVKFAFELAVEVYNKGDFADIPLVNQAKAVIPTITQLLAFIDRSQSLAPSETKMEAVGVSFLSYLQGVWPGYHAPPRVVRDGLEPSRLSLVSNSHKFEEIGYIAPEMRLDTMEHDALYLAIAPIFDIIFDKEFSRRNEAQINESIYASTAALHLKYKKSDNETQALLEKILIETCESSQEEK
jgi:hypothetical protein